MTSEQFVATIRAAQSEGKSILIGRLKARYRGVRNVRLVINGSQNGNKHDIWIDSASGLQTKGRAYLGSKRIPQRLEGWPERFESLTV